MSVCLGLKLFLPKAKDPRLDLTTGEFLMHDEDKVNVELDLDLPSASDRGLVSLSLTPK